MIAYARVKNKRVENYACVETYLTVVVVEEDM